MFELHRIGINNMQHLHARITKYGTGRFGVLPPSSVIFESIIISIYIDFLLSLNEQIHKIDKAPL